MHGGPIDTIKKINSFLNNNMNLKQMLFENDEYGCRSGLGLSIYEDNFLSDFFELSANKAK